MVDMSEWLPGATGEDRAILKAELAELADTHNSPEAATRARAWVDFMRRLDAIEEKLAREVLRLHRDTDGGFSVCDGCDSQGDEAMPPKWPCRTTVMIADYYGIEVPKL